MWMTTGSPPTTSRLTGDIFYSGSQRSWCLVYLNIWNNLQSSVGNIMASNMISFKHVPVFSISMTTLLYLQVFVPTYTHPRSKSERQPGERVDCSCLPIWASVLVGTRPGGRSIEGDFPPRRDVHQWAPVLREWYWYCVKVWALQEC